MFSKLRAYRLWFFGRGITLGAENDMTRRTKKSPSPKRHRKEESAEESTIVDELAEKIRREVETTLGPDATYEQRRDYEAGLMGKILWKREDDDLRGLAAHTEAVEVEGVRYERLVQPSSAIYHGRWGQHPIEESLYRQAGVRNGPTIKPLEVRAGIIAKRLTPDFARIVGELGSDGNSREVERILQTVGMCPPSRSVLEKRIKLMNDEIVEQVSELEVASRATETVPAEVASISCGLDRFSVRMVEPVPDTTPEPKRRSLRRTPYVRTPPPPSEHHWRKAWVGSVSFYDRDGKELHTWRYATEADADASQLARRVAVDVEYALQGRTKVPVHVVQDAAPELRALPEALAEILPSTTTVRTLIDFEHLTGCYLDVVVDACEPEDDPYNMKSWYRGELIRDDGAIDRIWRSLRERAKRLPQHETTARKAVAAALSYIRHRKHMMRYASHHAANLAIGSGATESTCWMMQRRVKRPGQSWQVPGLRGTLATRALVASNRWHSAWPCYAAKHRRTVRCLA